LIYMLQNPYANLEKVREKAPLVHHITNWVTISECASMTRSTGALPVMAHAIDEVEEMTGLASALVLNMGTPTRELMEAMTKAGKAANKKKIPVVFDAVGVGATPYRTDAAKQILKDVNINILKGNAGEIGVLAGADAEVRGVESISLEGEIGGLAQALSETTGGTVIATGVVDHVVDSGRIFIVKNGHPFMGKVVGTGCMAASVIAAFASVETDTPQASANALSCYGVAAEVAAEMLTSVGPMNFKANLFDAMSGLNRQQVSRRYRIELI